jgi:hypothetical protein
MVVLVADRSQCFSCSSLSQTLRQLPTDTTGGVKALIVAVDIPGPLLANTLRAERLEGIETEPMGRRRYTRVFGRLPTPALFVVHNGVIRWRWTPPTEAPSNPLLAVEATNEIKEVLRRVVTGASTE